MSPFLLLWPQSPLVRYCLAFDSSVLCGCVGVLGYPVGAALSCLIVMGMYLVSAGSEGADSGRPHWVS